MNTDDLLDALSDLQHDLGKYIAMPVTMLPADASSADLREALRAALHETRRGPAGIQSAREVWEAFRAEVGDALAHAPAWDGLHVAVDRALAWAPYLDGNAPLDRGAVTEDLRGVSVCIRALIAAIQEAQ
jgi:hypothetical protein